MRGVLAVIPARYGSTRFLGKPLALINGVPMIIRVWNQVKKCKNIEKIIVATDDQRIKTLIEAEGGEALMTSSELPSGTDRVFRVSQVFSEFENIINVQGDEPLIDESVINKLIELICQPDTRFASLFTTLNQEELQNFNSVKVIVNQKKQAIYFSRYPIPFSRMGREQFSSPICFKHIGLYGYKKDFLKKFCENGISFLEKAESLEQLRALDMGEVLQMGEVTYEGRGVDSPEDIFIIENELNKRDLKK